MSSLQSAIHYFLQPLYSDPLVARVQVIEGEPQGSTFKCKVVCGSCGKSVVVTAGAGEEGGEGLRWPTNWDVHLRGHHSSRRLSGSGKDVRSHPYPQNGRMSTPTSPPPSASSKKRSFAESLSERNRDRPHSTTSTQSPSPRPPPPPPYSPQSPLPPPPPPNPHSPTHLEHLRYLELTEDPSILALEPYRALCRGCHTWISLAEDDGQGSGVRYSVFRWSRHVGGRGCKGLRLRKGKGGGEGGAYGGGGLEYVSRPIEPIPIRRASPPNPNPPHRISPGSMLSHRTLPPLVPLGHGNGNGMLRPELALPVIRTRTHKERDGEYEVLPPPQIQIRQSYSPPSPPRQPHHPERVPKQSSASPRMALAPYPPPHLPHRQSSISPSQGQSYSPREKTSPRLALSPYPPHPLTRRRSQSRDGSEVYEYRPLVPIPIHPPHPHREKVKERDRDRGRSISISSLLSSTPSPPSPPSPPLRNGNGNGGYYRERAREAGGTGRYYRPSPPPPQSQSQSQSQEYYRSRTNGHGHGHGESGMKAEGSGEGDESSGSGLGSSTVVVVRLESADREGEDLEDVDVEMKLPTASHVLVPASWDGPAAKREGGSRPSVRV